MIERYIALDDDGKSKNKDILQEKTIFIKIKIAHTVFKFGEINILKGDEDNYSMSSDRRRLTESWHSLVKDIDEKL